jgi:aerobic C4-dicarboxylate transport protein
VIGAFASNSLLQVLFFSVFFGAAIVVIGRERCMPVISLMETVLELIFKIMSWIMKVAPIGAFGAMAFIIGQYGLGTLGTYAKLIAACYGAAVVFIALLFLVAWGFARVPLWHFLKYTREEFLLALGTASTEAVMPRIMTKLTNAGCSRATTGLVVPTGYSFNLDGAAIYLSISLLFLAQAFGHHLDLGQQLAALGVLLLTSKGMAGVPGSSFLALSATAAALGIFPVAGVALLLGADRLMDSMRVVVNLLGNCVATFVVSKWEGQFDRSVMVRAFRGEITNHDSAIMLGVEDDFEDQELERISGGGAPSPKFRGGPNPEDIPGFQMSRPGGHSAPPERSSAAINHE